MAKESKIKRPLMERLYDKFIPEPTSGCWLWLAANLKDRDGKDSYGVIGVGREKDGTMLAHRASWLCHRGPIPAGMCLLHKCDNKLCVNPDHMRLGTYAENNADMKQKGRASRGERHYAAKLTADQVRAIRVDTRSCRALSRVYGVADSVISEIKTGLAWRHI